MRSSSSSTPSAEAHQRQEDGERQADRLTDSAYWDQVWSDAELPQEVRRAPGALYLNAILDVFDRYLPRELALTAIELGGAPGKYLAYVYRTFGYRVACLDYSIRGCEAARRNFELLGIPGSVYNADLFDESIELPRFDVVYSLGLIEHFTDTLRPVARHIDLLKPGGILLLGVPNFQGISHWFMARLAPRVLAQHELRAMDIRTWEAFESAFGLETVFKGYVGGFEPGIFYRREEATWRNALPFLMARVLRRLLSRHARVLRRFNGRLWSGYAMAIYRYPGPR